VHEVELIRQVYDRITAHGGSIDEFGIDDKVDVRRFVEEIVRTTIAVLQVPVLSDGQINTAQHPPSVKAFMDAARKDGAFGLANPGNQVKPGVATGKKKKRGRR